MALLCIKIGENELSRYPKFDRLSHHMDIVEVCPRKRDGNGKLLVRTMGVEGDKEYLGINVDLDDLSDEEFEVVRMMLREPHDVELRQEQRDDLLTGGRETVSIRHHVHKHLRRLDLANGAVIGISKAMAATIDEMGERRRQQREYDMTSITESLASVHFSALAKAFVSKATTETLEAELGLTVMHTIKHEAQHRIANPPEPIRVEWE